MRNFTWCFFLTTSGHGEFNINIAVMQCSIYYMEVRSVWLVKPDTFSTGVSCDEKTNGGKFVCLYK